jgi:hypothetical protein
VERLAWIFGAAGWLLSFGLSPFRELSLLAYVAGGLTICAIVLRSRRVHPRSSVGNPAVRALALGAKLVVAIAAVAVLVYLAHELIKGIAGSRPARPTRWPSRECGSSAVTSKQEPECRRSAFPASPPPC